MNYIGGNIAELDKNITLISSTDFLNLYHLGNKPSDTLMLTKEIQGCYCCKLYV